VTATAGFNVTIGAPANLGADLGHDRTRSSRAGSTRHHRPDLDRRFHRLHRRRSSKNVKLDPGSNTVVVDLIIAAAPRTVDRDRAVTAPFHSIRKPAHAPHRRRPEPRVPRAVPADDCRRATSASSPAPSSTARSSIAARSFSSSGEGEEWSVHFDSGRPFEKTPPVATTDDEGVVHEVGPRPTDADLGAQWGLPLAVDTPAAFGAAALADLGSRPFRSRIRITWG